MKNMLSSLDRFPLQQQHVDCKISDAPLKKGIKQHADGWDAASKAWAHMVLHLPHADSGFGMTFNDISKDAAFYTTMSRFVALLGAFPQERHCGSRLKTSSRPLRACVALNSFAFARSSASWPL